MITSKQIQNKIAEEIRNSKFTQVELATKLNIKQPTVAQYVSGSALPSLETFANLCKILDLNPAEILCLNND